MSDFTTRDGCFEAFLEQKKRADAAEAQLAALGKLRARTYILMLWQAIRDVCSVQTIGRIAMREKELRGGMS